MRSLTVLICLTFCCTYTFAQNQKGLDDARIQVERVKKNISRVLCSDNVTNNDLEAEREAWEAEIEGLFTAIEDIEKVVNDKCEAVHQSMSGRLVMAENKLANATQMCLDQIESEKNPLLKKIQKLKRENVRLEQSIPLRINEEKVRLGKTIQGLQTQLQEQQRMYYECMKEGKTSLKNRVEILEADKVMIRQEYADLLQRNQKEHDKQLLLLKDEIQNLKNQLAAKDNDISMLKEKNKDLASKNK